MVVKKLEGTEKDRAQMMEGCLGRVFGVHSKRGYENRGVLTPDLSDPLKYNICNGRCDGSISLMNIESVDLVNRRIQIS